MRGVIGTVAVLPKQTGGPTGPPGVRIYLGRRGRVNNSGLQAKTRRRILVPFGFLGDGMTTATHWAGRVTSALAALALIADGLLGLVAPQLFEADTLRDGFALSAIPIIALSALIPGVLYAVPRTALLGAILATGFLGGAICTHVRMNEGLSPPVFICLAIALLMWGGLYLRDPRVRALVTSGVNS